MSYETNQRLRERLEKIDASRANPYIRIRTDELRELLDDLDGCEGEVDALLRLERQKRET